MYWDPFEELNKMHQEMDRLFNLSFAGPQNRTLIGHSSQDKGLIKKGARTPVCHLQETESEMIATFEIPGVEKQDINLNVDDEYLEIKVESKKEEKSNKNDSYSYVASSRSFHRFMNLPKLVDSTKVNAEYKDGVLRVNMPKKKEESSKAKRIDIK